LSGQRQLVTLETVAATGLSPTELQDLVMARAAEIPDGAVARLYVDGADPESYRLLDLEAVRAAAGAGLHLQLHPTFMGVDARVELPDLDSMGARWHRYLEDQDLAGYDRDRITAMGDDYLARAVEEAI
jgi:hypothetical protein